MSTLEYSEQFVCVKSSSDNVYGCKLCPFSTTSVFPMMNSVIQHRTPVVTFNCGNSSTALYNCKDCNFHTELKLLIKKHIENNHKTGLKDEERNYNILKYGCENCSFETHFSLKWLQHATACLESVENPQIINANDPEMDCYKREKSANESDETTYHTITWHKCKTCPFRTKYMSYLKNHTIARHSDEQHIKWYKCEQCPYKTKLIYELNRHTTRMHSAEEDIKWYECQKCAFITKYSTSLKYHSISRHLNEQDIQWYKCYKCSYKCILRNTLKRHVNTWHVGRTYTCQICPDNSKIFQSDILLKKHLKRCHFNSAYIRWFECQNCPFKSLRHTALKSHVNYRHSRHSGKQDEDFSWFECQKCPFKSRMHAALKNHIHYRHPRHSGKQDEDFTWFHCEKCPYKAKFKHVLERHHRFSHQLKGDEIKRHECENPYIVENGSNTKQLITESQTGANIDVLTLRKKLNKKIVSANV